MCTGPQKRPNQSADGSVAERILERLLVNGSAPIDTERPPHGSKYQGQCPPWLERRWAIVQSLRQDFGKRQ